MATTQAQPEKPKDSPLLHPSLQVSPARDEEFPKLEVKQDAQGRIKEIVVICHCGERIVLQCTY
ncbi:MAG: hypothetical protein WCS65_16285 [Verrucomicrobiae bacterium]